MGFSVSGSFAIIALAALIAIGTVYPAMANGFESIRDAQRADQDAALERQNTVINITRAEKDGNTLEIEATNEGTTALAVSAVDIILDNTYVTHSRIDDDRNSQESVDGDTETELWLPGETYSISISTTVLGTLGVNPVERVKLVTGPGVTDVKEVT